MFARTTLFRASIKHRAPAALLCLGLGALGCSGGHFNLSSRTSRGEEIAASARQETQRPTDTDKPASSLARLLRMKREAPAEEPDAAAEPRNGRIFSAFVDRRPDGADAPQDPFLAAETAASAQPDQPTRRVTRTAIRNDETPASPAATGAARQKLSDADLWKLLEAEGAVAAVASPAQAAAVAPQVTDTPEWAHGPDAAPPVTPTHTSYETPAFAQGATEEPAGGRTKIDTLETSAPAAATVDADRSQVEALMAEAHRHAERGALHEAYHAAILAERLADREQLVFSPQQEQPADLARRLVEQMQTAPRHDPFGEISIAAVPGNAEAAEAPALAAPQFPEAVRQQPGSAPSVAAVAPSQRPAPAATGFNDAFPPAQEWRGVKANTPVSLAVVDESPTPFRRAPEPVTHAVLNAPADQPLAGSSLPRHLQAPAGSLWTGRPEGPALTGGPELPGPALTHGTDTAATSASVAPPPPLDLGAEHRRGTEPQKSDHAGAKPRRGGMALWVFGAIAMFAGAVLVKVRRRRSVTPA